MTKRAAGPRYEWRVTFRRENWLAPQSRYYQSESGAYRFAKRYRNGRPTEVGGYPLIVKIEKRVVEPWEPAADEMHHS